MLFEQDSIHSNVVGLAFVLRLLGLSLTAYKHVNEMRAGDVRGWRGREGGKEGWRGREREEGGMQRERGR